MLCAKVSQSYWVLTRMKFALVDLWNNAGFIQDYVQVVLLKVGHTDGSAFAAVQQHLHGPPCLRQDLGSLSWIRFDHIWPVHQVQVQVIRVQAIQRRPGGCTDRREAAVVSWPQFGGQKDLLAIDSRVLDSKRNVGFSPIPPSRV